MKRVLLTGGTGFIGRHAIQHLLERGFEVHLVSRSAPQEINDSVICHKADLHELINIDRLIAVIQPSHLLHFAWDVTPGKYWTSPDNVQWAAASLQLFQSFAAHGGERAVYAGSCAEYDWSHSVLDEKKTPTKGVKLYGETKNSLRETIEKEALKLGVSFGWGRIFLLYGPFEARNRLVSDVCVSLLQGKEALCSHGLQERDFMYVDDVARAFVMLLDSKVTGAVNIASGEVRTIKSVVERIGVITGCSSLIQFGAKPAAADDPPRLEATVSRLFEEVSFKPQYDLEKGLQETVEWWRKRN